MNPGGRSQRRCLTAEPERPPGGARRYTDEDLSRLGFSLDEILQLLCLDDGANCEAVLELAAAHLVDVRMRLASLVPMEAALSVLVSECSSLDRRDQVKCPLIAALHDPR